MASVIIKEVDATNSAVYSPTETIVFIPGMIGNDKERIDDNIVGIPTLFTDVKDFEAAIGKTPRVISGEAETIELDKSYIMAKQLISLGMSVLYEVVPFEAEGTIRGSATTAEEMYAALSTDTFWQELSDRSLYNPRFITSGGYPAIQQKEPAAEPVVQAMINLASYAADGNGNETGRGDCVALIDHPKDIKTINAVSALFNGQSSNFANGQFATAFTPWCKFGLTADLNLDITDENAEHYTDITKLPNAKPLFTLPASFAYLLAYNNMLKSNNTWYAAAGRTRGEIPLLDSPLAEYGEKACKAIQPREEGKIAINPITNFRPYGYRIYGNRTLRQNSEGLKATSFLHIRNLVSDIKKTCYQACRIMTFEQNTDIMWVNLKGLITPLLDRMKDGNGISAYAIKRVPTNDRAKVVGVVSITPVDAVEDFELTIELSDSIALGTESE